MSRVESKTESDQQREDILLLGNLNLPGFGEILGYCMKKYKKPCVLVTAANVSVYESLLSSLLPSSPFYQEKLLPLPLILHGSAAEQQSVDIPKEQDSRVQTRVATNLVQSEDTSSPPQQATFDCLVLLGANELLQPGNMRDQVYDIFQKLPGNISVLVLANEMIVPTLEVLPRFMRPESVQELADGYLCLVARAALELGLSDRTNFNLTPYCERYNRVRECHRELSDLAAV